MLRLVQLWGLNDWIKENAKRLAEKGYVTIAPDLYRGKVTDDMKMASQLRKGMPQDRAMRDLKAAVDTVAAMPSVNKDRIGSIGWCMGGGLSLQLALADPRVKAMAICYGAVVTDAGQLKSLKAPVLGIFGEDDKGIPAAGVREFEKALKGNNNAPAEVNIYTKAGHGFMRPTNGSNPNAEHREMQARDAWQKIDAFFARTLKK